MNDKLLKAILVMDSYNRGYNQGIGGLASIGSIGNATILRESDVAANSTGVKAGFYAIAYTLQSGETVVSYRGTDDLNGTLGNLFLDGDILNGYGGGIGVPGTPQADLAVEFYKTVVGDIVGPVNVSVTGHSLGGGLAGLVGALYGKGGELFDNMAYENAANDNTIQYKRVA